MLLRTGNTQLALGQIEEGLELDQDARFYITKGVILADLAVKTESIDIARRRLTQSEACFYKALSMNNKDEYSYQSLAQLYLNWSKKVPTEEEAINYIAKAEDVIEKGLKVVQSKDSLWIESANIQKWLGDEPSRIIALETAVKESPSSIIARYLLGRAYRIQNRMKESINTLEPIIKTQQDEFRVFIEYAIALANLEKTYKGAIAILRISTLYGLSDPRFIATLGGMEFMNNNFTEAENIFKESSKRNFSNVNANTIHFIPLNFQNPNEPISLQGKVVSVRPGYSFVIPSDYPRFLCPSSKYNGLVLQEGLTITFEPAFTAKGNIATKPRIA